MTIRMEDLKAGRVDLDEVADGDGRPVGPIHPGTILRDEFLVPMGLSVYALAAGVSVPRTRINDVVNGRRGISADTALRLSRFLGTSPDLWLGLQMEYDLGLARMSLGDRLEREIKPYAA